MLTIVSLITQRHRKKCIRNNNDIARYARFNTLMAFVEHIDVFIMRKNRYNSFHCNKGTTKTHQKRNRFVMLVVLSVNVCFDTIIYRAILQQCLGLRNKIFNEPCEVSNNVPFHPFYIMDVFVVCLEWVRLNHIIQKMGNILYKFDKKNAPKSAVCLHLYSFVP